MGSAPSTVTVILLRADVGCNRPGPPPRAHIGYRAVCSVLQYSPVAGPAPTRGRWGAQQRQAGVGPHPIVDSAGGDDGAGDGGGGDGGRGDGGGGGLGNQNQLHNRVFTVHTDTRT
eukprot:scaffold24507_cov106-Isochrysis_galbana.AAC.4